MPAVTSTKIDGTTTVTPSTGWSKTWHTFLRLNFIKYWQIFKLISLSVLAEHL